MGTIANLIVKIGADISDFDKKMKLVSTGSNAMLIGLTAAGAAVGAIGLKSVIAAGQMEQTAVAFTTMLGSAEDATVLLKDLQKFATTTPFQFTEITQASKALLAFGISGDDMIKTLTSLGDIASGIGMPLTDLSEIYGKIKTQGKLYGDDIRQLGQRGIPIIAALAKQYGVNESAIKKMVENGQVGFSDLEKAFQNLTKEGSQFGGLMDAQSKTLLGKWSNFKDSLSLTMIAVGNSISDAFNLKGVLDSVNSAMTRLTSTLETGGLSAVFNDTVKLSIVSIASAITVSAIPALYGMATAAWAAIAPLLPLIALGAALGAVGYTIYKIATANKTDTSTTQQATAATDTRAKKTKTLTDKLKELEGGLKKTTTVSNKMIASFDEINQLGGTENGGLIDASSTIAEINKIKAELAKINSPDITPKITPLTLTNDLLFGSNWQSGIKIIGEGGFGAWWKGFSEMMNPMKFFNMLGEMMQPGINYWTKEFPKAITQMFNPKPLGDIISGFFSSGWESAKNTLNSMYSGINDFLVTFNKITGRNVPLITLMTPSVPESAWNNARKNTAVGGVFTSPTVRRIGEAGAEAVVPLENNLGWIDMLAEKINGGKNNNQPIIIELDGVELGRATINSIQNYTRRTGVRLA